MFFVLIAGAIKEGGQITKFALCLYCIVYIPINKKDAFTLHKALGKIEKKSCFEGQNKCSLKVVFILVIYTAYMTKQECNLIVGCYYSNYMTPTKM